MPRKFEILEKAPEAPFKCIVSGLRGPVVDLDKFVEGYGRVYLHVNIVAAMTEKLGFLRDDAAQELRNELAAARAEVDRWPGALATLEEEIHELVVRAGVRARGALADHDDGAAGDDAAGAGAHGEGADGAAGADGGRAGGERRERVPADAASLFDQPDVLSE